MNKRAVFCLLLIAASNAWAQQDEPEAAADGSDRRLEFKNQLLESCQKQVLEFNRIFVSAGRKKPSKAMLNSYCTCVGNEALNRFSDEDVEALDMENKNMDDADIKYKLGQVVNICVEPLLAAP